MRHLLLPVFSLFAVALHAQTPFAPVGAQWTYTQGNFGGPDSTIAVFQVLSDTMLQGRSCSRVTTTEGWFVCHEVVQYLSTSNDSTYYFNEDQQRFHLLFRWNAVPGDTWSTPITQDGAADTLDWTVSDTGHVAIGGSVLRTLTVGQTSRQNTLYCPLAGVITEQLGGNAPFTWLHGACDAEIYLGLRCYEENIFPLPEPPPPPPISWLNPQYPQCALSDPVPAAIRFDDHLGMWFVARTFPEGNIQNPSFAATRTTRYFFNGATEFGGEIWLRLLAHHTWDGSPSSTYMGAVRQTGSLVLFLDTTLTVDTLYNFNLQVGDSMRYPDFGAPSPYLTVEAIDTVMIQDYPHRRYKFSEYPQTLEDLFTDTWIEGMGSIHGPLAPRMPSSLGYHYGFPDSTRTTCYFRWQDQLWHHPGYPSCTSNILMGMEGPDKPVAHLYPNPATDAVKVDGLPSGKWPYRITDALGRICLQGWLGFTAGRALIDLGELPKGLYLMHIGSPVPGIFRLMKE